jgi:hypothetical protein
MSHLCYHPARSVPPSSRISLVEILLYSLELYIGVIIGKMLALLVVADWSIIDVGAQIVR